MSSYLPSSRRELKIPHLIGAAVISITVLWTLKALLRQFIKTIWPAALPGNRNTASLATARAKSTSSPSTKDLEDVREYDYIIIGTGTAGCVLASRLTEDPSTTVLAIEAGDSDAKQLFSRIPAGVTKLWHSPILDWRFYTTPQPHCNNRKLKWPRGKMIGGCSSNNAMMYNKGAPGDYDEWERLGNKGWSYKNMYPYLKKAEKFHQPPEGDIRRLPEEDYAQHGQDGVWSVRYPVQAEVTTVFPDACDEVGIPKVADINTERGMLGATAVQTFIDMKGQRSSAAVAYLRADVVQRPNLKIASGQVVTKTIFDTSGPKPRAMGVEMASSKLSPIRYLARAKEEVLVCAGAIGTPHLLKLSGIGAKEELEQYDIPLVKELPGVGENLMDHMAFHGVTFKTDPTYSIHFLQDPIKNVPAIIQWLRDGTGPMAGQASDSFAFLRACDREDAPASVRANDRASDKDSPDMELIAMSLCFSQHGKWVAPQDFGYGALSAVCLRPESKGTVKLVSGDIFDAPLIDPNALSTDYDIDMLLYGAKLCARIVRSEPYKKYFKGWYSDGPYHPIDWDNTTDEEIKAHIRKSCETLYHPMGTAKMGSGSDAVVDDELRVHGIDGLRVVDASIFPTALACHPCAPVIGIAERAVDLIRGRA
ncbi:alcohol oxidase [Tothia fuscella]|uniref:Alcohol oxidase n=1 Tax=Tothia fuscella TaxID=1048955 RepID=A0A9P4NFW1_9PEZI|nr:alcohol oxidase [Tothia fuscella]